MATAKVIIAGQNNIGPAVKSAQGDITSLSNAAQKAGDVLKKAFTVTAIVAALKKLGDSCAECFNAFWEAERKYKQLQIALGNTSAYNQATATIRKLSRQTLSSKADVESMVSELAALGKNADDIDRISSAAVYLSNVTGKDLNSSMTTLLGTFNGTTTQLKKLGIDVSDLTKEELAQGAAVDRVISSLKTYSEQLAQIDTRQHLTNIKNSWGDIRQSVGDLVNFSFAPMIARFDNALSSMRDRFNTFVQNVKIVFSNFPEFISKLGETIKSMLGHFFNYDNIKNVFSFLEDYIITKAKNTLTNIANMVDLVVNAIPDTIRTIADGVFNYLMYLLTNWCDEVGVDISGLVNSIGKWLTDSPLGKVIDKTISTTVNGIRLIGGIIRNIPDMVRLVADNIRPILSNFWVSLKNGFISSIQAIIEKAYEFLDRINFPQMIENVRVSVTNFFGRIGAWFRSIGLTAKDTFRYIGEILSATFSWNSIKTIFTTLFKNIGVLAATVIKEIFVNIPSMIGSLFTGIVQWIGYVAVHLKNTVLQSIQDVIQSTGEKLQSTWVGKLFGVGGKLAAIDLGIDRTAEENLKAKADESFASIGNGFSKAITDAIDAAAVIKENNKAIADLYDGIESINVAAPDYTEITAQVKESGAFVERLWDISQSLRDKVVDNSEAWQDIGSQFSALLNPVFEKFVTDNSTTIGETLATWTARSSDEYYEAAKTSFSSIGSFLKDWGKQTFGDLKDGWSEQWEKISSAFTNVFGDDVSGFVTWFQGFLSDHADDTTTAIVPVLNAVEDVEDAVNKASKTFLDKLGDKIGSWAAKITGSTSEQGSAFGGSVISSMTSSLGQAGEVAGKLAQNMATMGPLLGAIATALEYVFKGLSETLGPMLNEFVSYGIEPLKELGRVIGDILLPTLEDVMPLVKDVADFLVGLFRAVGVVLKPVIQVISSSLTPVMSMISNILQALTPVLKVFAKIFVTVTGTIQYVIQTLQHWVATLMNWLAGLDLFGWQPFAGLRMNDPGSPGK
ncbi:MAG: hypothetical protein J5599_03090, partial [Spirochaetales bacterium]|nr:hypothetical protein [Spirochaetales bacterium]